MPRQSDSSGVRITSFAGRNGRPQGFQLGIPLLALPRRIPYILLQTAMRTNSSPVTRTEDTGKGISVRGVRRGLTVTSSSGWGPGIGGYFRVPFRRSSGTPRTGHCLLMRPEIRSCFGRTRAGMHHRMGFQRPQRGFRPWRHISRVPTFVTCSSFFRTTCRSPINCIGRRGKVAIGRRKR